MITEKEILRQIINIISVNLQRESRTGLLQGKIGIAILLYHYLHYSGNDRYAFFPEEYLGNIEKYISAKTKKNIADEVGGIGWGIDYMIRKGLVDADDDVLDEVDETMGEKMGPESFLKEVAEKLPLFSKGLYFLQRDKSEMVRESLLEVINYIKTNQDFRYPLMYINSIVYVALVSSKKYSNIAFCDELLDYLYEFATTDTAKKIDSQDYLLLKKNISLMSEHQASKWSGLISEDQLSSDVTDCYWIDFLFPEGERIPVDVENIHSWLQSFLQQFDYERLSIYKGLAGIGLAIINKQNNNNF